MPTKMITSPNQRGFNQSHQTMPTKQILKKGHRNQQRLTNDSQTGLQRIPKKVTTAKLKPIRYR